jgi:hypothetical protein
MNLLYGLCVYKYIFLYLLTLFFKRATNGSPFLLPKVMNLYLPLFVYTHIFNN